MALLHRVRKLVSIGLIARVSAGASAGVLLALALHPRSRSLVLDGLRPSPPVLALQGGPIGLPPIPDPSSQDAASFWLAAYVVNRSQGRPFGHDQLLLFAEIAQAGRRAEPRNGFWPQVESLAMEDLGNEKGRAEAVDAYEKSTTWRLAAKTWKDPFLSRLQRWSGGSFAWHQEAASAGPEARVAAAFIELPSSLGRRELIARSLSPEARDKAGVALDGDAPFTASWPQWRLSCLLAEALAAGLFVLLAVVRGFSRWGSAPEWGMAASLTVILGLSLPDWLPAAGFGAAAAVFLAPGRTSAPAAPKGAGILTACAAGLAALSPLAALARGYGVFSYLAVPGMEDAVQAAPFLAALLGAAGVALKARLNDEAAREAEWKMLGGALWILCASLLFAAATATALLALEQNGRMGIGR